MKLSSARNLVSALLLALIVFGASANAQEAPPEQVAQDAVPVLDIPDDELGRGTPRRSLLGFLTAAQDRDFETAAEYLDLRNLPAPANTIDSAILAQLLAVVLERELWIDIDDVSDHPDGASSDGLPSYRDGFAELAIGDRKIELLLQRVPGGNDDFIWKISNRSVAEIPVLYAEFGYGPVENWLHDNLPDITILNVELFKWVIVLGTAIVAYPILLLLLRGLATLIVKQASPVRDLVRQFLTGPFLWLLIVIITNYVTYSLGLGIEAQRLADAHTINIIVVAWVLLSTTNLVRAIYRNRLESQGKNAAVVLLGPLGNAAKILIVLLAALLWLSNLGFNITALLAGLGVGGIAVALALQKPLEDLFGAVSMYTQQPAKVGDFCRFGDILGTIEEIGLRTTRIRTLSNTMVSIPNAKIAGDILDNYSARQRMWYHPTLVLRYDSTSNQLDEILTNARAMLDAHEKVHGEPIRMRFTGFGREGFELNIHAYIKTSDYAEYLEISEQLNFAIVDIVTKSGTAFAVPVHLRDAVR